MIQLRKRVVLFKVAATSTQDFITLVKKTIDELCLSNVRIVDPVPFRFDITSPAMGPLTTLDEEEYQYLFVRDGVGSSKMNFLAWALCAVDETGVVKLVRLSPSLSTVERNEPVTTELLAKICPVGWRRDTWREIVNNRFLPDWGLEEIVADTSEEEQREYATRARLYLTDNPNELATVLTDVPKNIFSHPLFSERFEREETVTVEEASEIIKQILLDEGTKNSMVAWYIWFTDENRVLCTTFEGATMYVGPLVQSLVGTGMKSFIHRANTITVDASVRNVYTEQLPILNEIRTAPWSASPAHNKTLNIVLVNQAEQYDGGGIILPLTAIDPNLTREHLGGQRSEPFSEQALDAVIEFYHDRGLKVTVPVPVGYVLKADGVVEFSGSYISEVTTTIGVPRTLSGEYHLPGFLLKDRKNMSVTVSRVLRSMIDQDRALIQEYKHLNEEN